MGKDLQKRLRLPKGFYKFIVAKRINETQTLAGRGNNIIINIWIIPIKSGDKREVYLPFSLVINTLLCIGAEKSVIN